MKRVCKAYESVRTVQGSHHHHQFPCFSKWGIGPFRVVLWFKNREIPFIRKNYDEQIEEEFSIPIQRSLLDKTYFLIKWAFW